MTATITNHALLLRDMAEQAYWVLRQLRESAPDGQVVATEISAPLDVISRFAAEIADHVDAGRTHQPATSLPAPPPRPTPLVFTFTMDGLAEHNRRIFTNGFEAGRNLPTVRPA